MTMAEWWPFDRSWADEWRRNWAEMLNMSTTASRSFGLLQPGTLPGDPFVAIMDAARGWLIEKKRTFRVGGRDLTLVLSDISVEGSDLGRVVGQYGQVRIAARDVRWGGYQLGRMQIQARNVHLRAAGVRPVVVAAPVLIEAFVSASVASRWLATVSPRLELTLRDGVPQIALAAAPWARLEVEAGGEGRSIRIRPRVLHLGSRRLALRLPPFHIPLPPLPDGVVLTSVEPAPEGFVLRGMLGEWQRSLSRQDVDRLLAVMRAGTDRLDL